MLATNNYTQDYIEHCRGLVEDQLNAYAELSAAAEPDSVAGFEPLFFNHMLLALDAYFAHRARGLEGKDGNALNEVRVLCSSILNNYGELRAEKSIKQGPGVSILPLQVGDQVALTMEEFSRLAEAFFEQIELRYG